MRPREHFLAIAMGVILVLGFAFWWKTAMSTNKPVGPMFFPLLLMFCIGAVAPAALIMALGMRFFWLLATTVVLLIAFGIVKFVLYCPKGVLGGVGFLMFAISSLRNSTSSTGSFSRVLRSAGGSRNKFGSSTVIAVPVWGGEDS